MLGQSNMAGRGFIKEVLPIYNERIQMLRNARYLLQQIVYKSRKDVYRNDGTRIRRNFYFIKRYKILYYLEII